MRRLLTLLLLAICALWLLFAYVPSLQKWLPTLAFTGNGLWMATLGALGLIAFIALQCWLVYTTVRTVRLYQTKGARPGFRLHLGTELFWTALPIVMTIGLAWASYPLWANLIQR